MTPVLTGRHFFNRVELYKVEGGSFYEKTQNV